MAVANWYLGIVNVGGEVQCNMQKYRLPRCSRLFVISTRKKLLMNATSCFIVHGKCNSSVRQLWYCCISKQCRILLLYWQLVAFYIKPLSLRHLTLLSLSHCGHINAVPNAGTFCCASHFQDHSPRHLSPLGLFARFTR